MGYGILMKKNVYEDFVTGAKDGLKTVVQILPTLVGLMVGVGILRASGFLDLLGDLIGQWTRYIGYLLYTSVWQIRGLGSRKRNRPVFSPGFTDPPG